MTENKKVLNAGPQRTMNIGQAARASGVHPKMLRHYEEIGLLPKARRSDAGYRLYEAQDVHSLQFIKRARDLGFSTAEIKKLIGLWRNRRRQSAEVKRLALQHIEDLQVKIRKLEEMRNTLQDLAVRCHGDQRPDCPILSGLAE